MGNDQPKELAIVQKLSVVDSGLSVASKRLLDIDRWPILYNKFHVQSLSFLLFLVAVGLVLLFFFCHV